MPDAPNDGGEENANLAQLREKADRSDALAAENRELKMGKAFNDAGISTKEGTPGALLFQNFQPGEGQEITSAAVLEAAERFGIKPGDQAAGGEQQQGQEQQQQNGEEPTMKQGATPEEQAFFDQSRKAAGGEGGDGGSVDPNDAGYQAFDSRIKDGATRQDAAAAGMAKMFEGAAAGDKRVLYDQGEWRDRNS